MNKISKALKSKRKVIVFLLLILGVFVFVKYVQSNRYLISNDIIDLKKQIQIPKIEDDWIPQGIAKTDDYLFISAYDPKMEESKSEKGGRPSVIIVIDNHSHKHIKTISFKGKVDDKVIDLRSHFGAIDYVKENNTLYIADSTNKILWQVSMDDIYSIINSDGETAKVEVETILVEREVKISFLKYYDGLLYIGQHDIDSKEDNFMIGYDSSNQAMTNKIPLQKKSQGISFVNYKNQLYLLTSSSRGVDNPSVLFVEKIEKTKDGNGKTILNTTKVKEFDLPNMSEDLYVDKDNVYIVFESAAEYYNKSFKSLFTEKRHILVTTMDTILD